MGNQDTTLTCGFHGAQFEVATGKKIGEPKLESLERMEPLPKSWQKYLEYIYKMMAPIKTHRKTYEISVEGDEIKIRILI
jgi:nitrite reductase/ring-hydroxylating ferredoxin subunit